MNTFRAALVGMLALAGCEPPAPGPPAAWVSLTTMQSAYNADPQAPIGAGLSSVFTAGFPASYFLSAPDRVRLSPVYTSGQQMAYITTDVWVNFEEIWLQPLYVFIAAWDERVPSMATWVDIPWVATVGESSAFWSPFFRVYYVVVPADTPRDRFRSSRDVLSSGFPIFPGQARLLTLQPPGGMKPDDPSTVLLPELRVPDKVGSVRSQAVWVEGQPDERLALDFGPNRFEWNERYEILEQPLFFFFVRSADGEWLPLTSVPRVGGTGPLFERRPAIAPANRPRFGSNWRLWSVRLPDSARLFVPPHRMDEWEVRNQGWTANLKLARAVSITGTPEEAAAALDHHAYKVLLDDTCLAPASITADDLAKCPWLDSQEALEARLPAALLPSEILVACPYVSYAGAAVPNL
jgi:hypothetical protein